MAGAQRYNVTAKGYKTWGLVKLDPTIASFFNMKTDHQMGLVWNNILRSVTSKQS